MRKNFQKNRSDTEKGILNRCFYREFCTVSDCIYYSIILENDYTELSDFFERAAVTETECVKDIGRAIIYLGGNPKIQHSAWDRSIDPRNFFNSGKLDIKCIIQDIAECIRKNLSEYDRLLEIVCDGNVISLITRVSLKKRELLYILEQMIRS